MSVYIGADMRIRVGRLKIQSEAGASHVTIGKHRLKVLAVEIENIAESCPSITLTLPPSAIVEFREHGSKEWQR